MFLQIEPLKICIYKYICTCGVLNIYAAKCFSCQKQTQTSRNSSPLLPHLFSLPVLPHLSSPPLSFLTAPPTPLSPSPLLPHLSSPLLLAIHDFYTGFRPHLVSHCNKQMFRSFICANVLYVFVFCLLQSFPISWYARGAQRNPVSACNKQKNPCLLVVRDYNHLFVLLSVR